MSDWASRAAARDKAADQSKQLQIQKELRHARMKDRRGVELFQELNDWMSAQVNKYNEEMGKKVLEVSVPRASVIDLESERVFTVSQVDRTKQNLEIRYFPDVYRLRCQSGFGNREYLLTVGTDDEVRFRTPYNVKTVAEVGEELLDEWHKSQF